MCDCLDNYPEFFTSDEVTARKRHRCCECLRVIEPGEKYERVNGKWDGEFATYATCANCLDLRLSLKLKCWCYSGLVDDVSEYRDDRMPPDAKAFLDRRKANWERLRREKQEANHA